jgi:uncharacterized protein
MKRIISVGLVAVVASFFLAVCGRNDDDSAALIAASSRGQVDVVEELLKAGADINAKDNDGATALVLASDAGHAEVQL